MLSAGPCIRPADGRGRALVRSTRARTLAVALRTGFSTIGCRLFCDSSALAFHITAEFPSGPFLVGIEGRPPATRRSTGGVENRPIINCYGSLAPVVWNTNHHLTRAAFTLPVVSRKADVIDASITAAHSLGTQVRRIRAHAIAVTLALFHRNPLILEDTFDLQADRITIGVRDTMDSHGYELVIRRPDRVNARNGPRAIRGQIVVRSRRGCSGRSRG